MQRNLLRFEGLASKGIDYSRQHVDRLIKAGTFPRPIKLGKNRNAWIEEEIDAYVEARIKERDQLHAEAA
jgi:prophage regulatory protein